MESTHHNPSKEMTHIADIKDNSSYCSGLINFSLSLWMHKTLSAQKYIGYAALTKEYAPLNASAIAALTS